MHQPPRRDTICGYSTAVDGTGGAAAATAAPTGARNLVLGVHFSIFQLLASSTHRSYTPKICWGIVARPEASAAIELGRESGLKAQKDGAAPAGSRTSS